MPVAVTSILTSMVTSSTVHTEALRRAPVTGTALQARKKRPFLLDLYSTSVGKKSYSKRKDFIAKKIETYPNWEVKRSEQEEYLSVKREEKQSEGYHCPN